MKIRLYKHAFEYVPVLVSAAAQSNKSEVQGASCRQREETLAASHGQKSYSAN